MAKLIVFDSIKLMEYFPICYDQHSAVALGKKDLTLSSFPHVLTCQF